MGGRKRSGAVGPRWISTPDAKGRLGKPGNGLFWKWAEEEFGPPVRLSDRKLIWDADKIDAFIARRAAEGYEPEYHPGMRGHAAKLDAKTAEQVRKPKRRGDPKPDVEAAERVVE